MLCTIWYHLRNLKNVKNTHGGMIILLLKLQTEACHFTKSITTPLVLFMFFLNCTRGTKSRKASHIVILEFKWTITSINSMKSFSIKYQYIQLDDQHKLNIAFSCHCYVSFVFFYTWRNLRYLIQTERHELLILWNALGSISQ